jgi:broad specificity phosphatase PhoE
MEKQVQTVLTLVRHGETEWNNNGRSQGQSDVPLNDRGQAQAKATGIGLSAKKFDAVYASPLSRAYDTAQAIVDHHSDLEIVTEPDLMEINLGQVEGKSFRDVGGEFIEVMKQWVVAPEEVTFPDGESPLDVQDRVYPVIDRIIEQHRGERVLIVSHYFVTAMIVCRVLGLPVNSVWRLQMANASISIVIYNEQFGPRLALFNRIFWEEKQLPGQPIQV